MALPVIADKRDPAVMANGLTYDAFRASLVEAGLPETAADAATNQVRTAIDAARREALNEVIGHLHAMTRGLKG